MSTIEKNINELLLRRDPSAESIIKHIESLAENTDLGKVIIYHQFPFYKDEIGKTLNVHILFVSQNYGIIIFRCLETLSRKSVDFEKILEELKNLDSLIFSKLIKNVALQKNRRELKFNLTPLIYLHSGDSAESTQGLEGFDVVNTFQDIQSAVYNNLEGNTSLSEEEFLDLVATIEGSKVITKPSKRLIKNSNLNTKGSILNRIESEIANFDKDQKRAALFTLDGAQRIRGLAGTGKTIILSMKAALIHLQDSNSDILYTYYTKALGELVKSLITRFYRQYSERDPDWEKIHIMHAWGGISLEGVYYNACKFNGIPPMRYIEAKSQNPKDPFDFVCGELNNFQLKKQYDYALLDEAQDFPINFYRLCRNITNENRVVWAYDDFQNILDIKIQNEKETFGKNKDDEYYVDFSLRDDKLQDVILHKCYRNPRQVLLTAFALGLGIYNENGKIVQRLENNQHWESLGFTVESGNSNIGDEMIISRSKENSPLLFEDLTNGNQIQVQVESFENVELECNRVVELIIQDLNNELLPQDINVISLDDRHSKLYFNLISHLLERKGVKVFNLQNAPSNNIHYKIEDHITLSTIYKAKGNEAGSVYIVGIDAVFIDKDDLTARNKIFTAITRSKGWVTLTGIKPYADFCKNEVDKLFQNELKLIFRQPSEEDVVTIRQDISEQQRKLNEMERIANELKKLGLSEDEVKEKFLNRFLNEKQ